MTKKDLQKSLVACVVSTPIRAHQWESLYKAKGFGAKSGEEACPQQGTAGVQRDVETEDAGVGCGQPGVIRRPQRDAGVWLVGLNVGWEGGATSPEVEQLLSLPVTHPLHHRPEPGTEPGQHLFLFLCVRIRIRT